jgi:mRNA interferase MazF
VKRGDVVVAAVPGDYGKARPYVVVQSEIFPLDSITLCPLTTDLRTLTDVRVFVAPGETNGLQAPSMIMVDKIVTVRLERVSRRIGGLEQSEVDLLDRALMVFLGLT